MSLAREGVDDGDATHPDTLVTRAGQRGGAASCIASTHGCAASRSAISSWPTLIGPRTTRRAVARQSVQSTAVLLTEMGPLWSRPWSETSAMLTVEGIEAVTEPLASGRGVIVLGPHLGNWELLGMHLATLGRS